MIQLAIRQSTPWPIGPCCRAPPRASAIGAAAQASRKRAKEIKKSKSCKSIFDEANKKGRFSRCAKRGKRSFFWFRRLERDPEALTPAIGSPPPAHAQGARAPLLGLLGAVLLHGGDNALDNPPGDDGDGNHDDNDLHDVREALDLLRHGLPRIAGVEAQRAQHGVPHQ